MHQHLKSETVSFYEASLRIGCVDEVLLGYVEKDSRTTVLNPKDKTAEVLSCARVHVFLTLAGSEHNH